MNGTTSSKQSEARLVKMEADPGPEYLANLFRALFGEWPNGREWEALVDAAKGGPMRTAWPVRARATAQAHWTAFETSECRPIEEPDAAA